MATLNARAQKKLLPQDQSIIPSATSFFSWVASPANTATRVAPLLPSLSAMQARGSKPSLKECSLCRLCNHLTQPKLQVQYLDYFFCLGRCCTPAQTLLRMETRWESIVDTCCPQKPSEPPPSFPFLPSLVLISSAEQ